VGIQPDASEQKRFRQQAVQTERKPSELVAGDVLSTTGGTHLGIRREGRATVATLIQGGRAGRANANHLAKHVDKTHLLGDSVALVVNPASDSTPR